MRVTKSSLTAIGCVDKTSRLSLLATPLLRTFASVARCAHIRRIGTYMLRIAARMHARLAVSLTVAALLSAGSLVVQTPANAASTYCLGKLLTISGTSGGDILYGTASADVITGLQGDDDIYGLGAGDTLCGGEGNDRVYGRGGGDVVAGQAGDDLVLGAGGTDRVYGDEGPSTATFADGDDTVDGGKGADTLYGGDGGDYMLGGAGNDYINAGWSGTGTQDHPHWSWDTVSFERSPNPVNVQMALEASYRGTATGDGSDTIIEVFNIRGSVHDDVISSAIQSGFVFGGAGDDTLKAVDADYLYRQGNVGVFGEAGDDTLLSVRRSDGTGVSSYANRLEGSAGSDVLDATDGFAGDVLYGDTWGSPILPGYDTCHGDAKDMFNQCEG